MGGGRVPGAEAPCFSVGGDARTEVRAYLRSKSKGGESVLREGCGHSRSGVGSAAKDPMAIDPIHARFGFNTIRFSP